jgi:hypothetical protein
MLNTASRVFRTPEVGELWRYDPDPALVYMRVSGLEQDTPAGRFASVELTGDDIGSVLYCPTHVSHTCCNIIKSPSRELHISPVVNPVPATPMPGQLWTHCPIDMNEIFMCIRDTMPATIANFRGECGDLDMFISVRMFCRYNVGRACYTVLPEEGRLGGEAPTYILREQSPLEI